MNTPRIRDDRINIVAGMRNPIYPDGEKRVVISQMHILEIDGFLETELRGICDKNHAILLEQLPQAIRIVPIFKLVKFNRGRCIGQLFLRYRCPTFSPQITKKSNIEQRTINGNRPQNTDRTYDDQFPASECSNPQNNQYKANERPNKGNEPQYPDQVDGQWHSWLIFRHNGHFHKYNRKTDI